MQLVVPRPRHDASPSILCPFADHYLRNTLFVEDYMGEKRAERHVPAYAKALMQQYDDEMRELKTPSSGASGGASGGAAGGSGDANLAAQLKAWGGLVQELLLL